MARTGGCAGGCESFRLCALMLALCTACVSASLEDEGPAVCFVIRTYWGHGDQHEDQPLRTLLTALQSLKFSRWNAMLLVMDERPFEELRHILLDLHDERMWVYKELVGPEYRARMPDDKNRLLWAQDYHTRLYNLTDEAIRACSPSSEWVVVTNGDNNYDPHFLDHVMAAPADADVVSFDFYSRYQRLTVDPCDRFAAGPGLPMCKENIPRMCHTDLAANAYRWRRLVDEKRRFTDTDWEDKSDGMFMELLVKNAWKVHHVSRCLVDHSPSPQRCAALGRIWDDTEMCSEDGYGGTCIDGVAAEALLDRDPYLEVVHIDMSYDPDSFEFGEVVNNTRRHTLRLTCVRKSMRGLWTQVEVFGPWCKAPVDRKREAEEHRKKQEQKPPPDERWIEDEL